MKPNYIHKITNKKVYVKPALFDVDGGVRVYLVADDENFKVKKRTYTYYTFSKLYKAIEKKPKTKKEQN